MSNQDNIVRFPGRTPPTSNGNNGHFGNRDIEIERRLATIEETLKHTATRAWVLGGVVGGCALAAGIALTVMKLFG